MRGPPVVLTNTLGRPVTNVISERGAVPMTVVNTLGEPVTLVASGGEPVTLFNANGTLWDYPFSLFSNNEQGAWYDPSDFSTLFQNAAGTTPVTAVEQPVRLMLDRSGRGNHATAPNDASRPVLRARYNLLTFSEQFDNAAWTKTNTTITANAAVAPDGTTTADQMQHPDAFPAPGITQAITVASGATVSASLYVKQSVAGFVRFFVRNSGSTAFFGGWFNTNTGAWGTTAATSATLTSASAETLANGWYRITLVGAITAETSYTAMWYLTDSDNSTTRSITPVIFLWGAQLLTAADQTSTGGAYQRIAAATDYDTSNPVWRPYLAFDGSDDSFSTSSIDFSGTDEMTVFAGVTKLSDAAVAIVMSYNGTSNASAEMFAPRNTSTNGDFAFTHRTTTVQEAGGGFIMLSPATAVLTGVSDISAPSVQLRRNGSDIQTNTTALAANNYTSGTIRIGHRSGNFYLNGRLYSLAVLGRTATAPELSAMEAWVAGKTGVVI